MPYYAPDEEVLDRVGIDALQRRKLAHLLEVIASGNAFYRAKLDGLRFDPSRDAVSDLPLTTRKELQEDQLRHPPFGSLLSFPAERYVHFHQTSGGSGVPLRWLDTEESWAWWKKCWATVLIAAGVTADDRVLFTFSFGPFIGFWSAFDAAATLGCICLPAGGMTTAARLRMLEETGATVVCCTPTYALHMAEVASSSGIDLADGTVRRLVVAGEPGGNIPATRERIEAAWGARVFDHAGMTEIGAWGFEAEEAPGGMQVIESEFIAEVIDPETLSPRSDGETGELVLTNLGRLGSPLIRYRTGDLVCLKRDERVAGRWFARAAGGVLGRIDDMLIVRGNNVFPSAIEGILRTFAELAEFRLCVDQHDALVRLRIEVEPAPGVSDEGLAERIGEALRNRLHFRPDVRLVACGTLPRFEMKARRIVYETRGE